MRRSCSQSTRDSLHAVGWIQLNAHFFSFLLFLVVLPLLNNSSRESGSTGNIDNDGDFNANMLSDVTSKWVRDCRGLLCLYILFCFLFFPFCRLISLVWGLVSIQLDFQCPKSSDLNAKWRNDILEEAVRGSCLLPFLHDHLVFFFTFLFGHFFSTVSLWPFNFFSPFLLVVNIGNTRREIWSFASR